MLNPQPSDYCHISPEERARLIVVIDTEEEFDWSRDFSRDNISVRSMQWIGRIQDIFDEYGITPVYIIDYPVASQSDGYQTLVEVQASGRCLIGAHLHPWVNPPFEEPVNRFNSFAGNLPASLEKAKLQMLTNCIQENFKIRPNVYKAGRYGIGLYTAEMLEDLEYEVDLRVCPYMDYSSEDGPDYTPSTAWPFWFGRNRRLLELPLTVGYTGLIRRWGTTLHALASQPLMAKFRTPGILGRLGFLNKIWLSPEGYPTSEHLDLVRTLYRTGLRVFSFAFHSPSVEPGNTPYVGSKADLDDFLERCRRFFDFFFGKVNGMPSTPLTLKEELGKA